MSCGNTLSAEGDILQSPNFPDEHDNNALCKNLIKAPEGYHVRLNFTHFYLDDNPNCQYESLKVYDGSDESSQLLGTYCGNELPQIIQSYGRYLYVVFTSDEEVTYSGYQATVSFAGKQAIFSSILKLFEYTVKASLVLTHQQYGYSRGTVCQFQKASI